MELTYIVIAGLFSVTAAGVTIVFNMLRSTKHRDNTALVKMIKEVKVDFTREIKDSLKETSKCEKILHRRIDKVDEGLNAKMSKGGCQRVQDRIAMETKHTRELVAAQGQQNTKEHEALIKTLEIVDKKQDASNEGMAEIITCLALLSENVPCIP